MTAGEFVARNAKAVVSVLGGIISVGTASAALFRYAPPSLAGISAGLLAALEVLRAVNVWIVKNEPALEKAADAGAELVAGVRDTVAPALGSLGASATKGA
jgi:hypothetical protein